MKKNKRENELGRWKIWWCGIKKSIHEETKEIASKLQYQEYFEIEEVTFPEVLWSWILFVGAVLIGIHIINYGKVNVLNCALGYIVLTSVLLSLYYTSLYFTWREEKVIRTLYKVVSMPFRIVDTYLCKLLKINYIMQYCLKCFASLAVSIYVAIHVLSVLSSYTFLFEDMITNMFPDAKVAAHMCILSFIIISMLVGMLIMYIMLRAMLVVFVPGDRRCKLNIFKKVWKEIKLLFYLLATILQFWGIVEGVLNVEVKYLLDAVLFIIVIDGYISMRNE